MQDRRQPINLKERMNAQLPKPEAVLKLDKPMEKVEQKKNDAREEKNRSIEAFFNDKTTGETKDYFSFEKAISKLKFAWLKKYTKIIYIVLIVLALIAAALVIFKVINNKNDVLIKKEWYAVKLVNDEIYYGQIGNIKSDPLVIEKVYYNYDSKNPEDQSNNLRLVKRGKESYGPSGVMNIIRTQILFIEPLKPDSKVLQAIMEYEK